MAPLDETEEDLPRQLSPEKAKSLEIEKIAMDKATFDRMHAADRMASEKLDEGISGFTKALESLEKLLEERLTNLDSAEG